MADARARSDYLWVDKAAWRTRAISVAYGALSLATLGFGTNLLLKLWLHRTIHLEAAVCWLAGTYVLLAIWEQAHWPIILGLGKLRLASNLMLLRAAIFAALLPTAARRGTADVIGLMCASIIIVTAWAYPQILGRILESRNRTHNDLASQTLAPNEAQ